MAPISPLDVELEDAGMTDSQLSGQLDNEQSHEALQHNRAPSAHIMLGMDSNYPATPIQNGFGPSCFADDMSAKHNASFRIGSLNIGKQAHAGKWPQLAHLLATIMANNLVDVLCLQETHLQSNHAIVKEITAIFADYGYHLQLQGPTTEDHHGRLYAGVAQIYPSSWLNPKQFQCPGTQPLHAGRSLGRKFYLQPPAPEQPHDDGSTIAICTHYGFTGASTAQVDTNPGLLENVLSQAQEVERCHRWSLDNGTTISVVCCDANLLEDPQLDAPTATQPRSYPDGFLRQLIDVHGYHDAVRSRQSRDEVPFTHQTPADGCSYLDRILVRGATVLQAGIIGGARLPLPMDHSLILADISCDPLHDFPLPEEIDDDMIQPPVQKFRTKVNAWLEENPQLHPADFAEHLDECVPAPAVLAQELLNTHLAHLREPTNSEEHQALMQALHTLADKFRFQIFNPLIAQYVQLQQTPAATKRKVALPRPAALAVAKIRILATASAFATHLDLTKNLCYWRSSAAAAPLGTDRLTQALSDAWRDFVHAMPIIKNYPLQPELPPNCLTMLHTERLMATLPGHPTGLTDLNPFQKALLKHVAQALHHYTQASIDQWRSAISTAYAKSAHATLFRLASWQEHIPMVDIDTTYRDQAGQTRVAATPDQRRKSTFQRMADLYSRPRFTPPAFFRQARDPVTGWHYHQLDTDPVRSAAFQDDPAYRAFCSSQSDSIDWDAILSDVSPQDLIDMEHARHGKAPGISGFKTDLLPFLPEPVKAFVHQLVTIMYRTCTIPTNLTVTKVAQLPKPTGGIRGISLMEELLKALDYLLLRRLHRHFKPGHSLADVLSPMNHAYKPGMSGTDVIHAHAFTVEDAERSNQPLVCALIDLAKFFDTIKHSVIEVMLGLIGAPVKIIRLVQAMYRGSTMRVITKYGATEHITRKVGVHQGSALSCYLCLLCLEPLHQALLVATQQPHRAYCFSGNNTPPLYALPKAYCDDFLLLACTLQALQDILLDIAPVLLALGIGFDAKMQILAFNIDLRQQPLLSVTSFGREQGAATTVQVPVDRGPQATYRLLGAHFHGAYVDTSVSANKLSAVLCRINKLRSQKLPAAITALLYNSVILPRTVGYAPLLSPHNLQQLSRLDTTVADLMRTSARLPIRVPRMVVFADTFGLAVQSAISAQVAAVHRETAVLFMDESPLGRMARHSYERLLCTQPPADTHPALLSRALHLLAQHGYYLYLRADITVGRILDELRGGPLRDWSPSVPPARADETLQQRRRNSRFSILGQLARDIMAHMPGHRHAQPQLHNSLRPYTPQQLANVRLQARADWANCRSMFGIPDAVDTVHEEYTAEDSSIADTRKTCLLLTPPEATALLRRNLNITTQAVTCTDGGTNTAAWAALSPQPSVPHQPYSAYHLPVAPDPTQILASCQLQIPTQVGTTTTYSDVTETCANIKDIQIRRHVAMGPCFQDNAPAILSQSEPWDLDTTARARYKTGRLYMHNARRYVNRAYATALVENPALLRTTEHLEAQSTALIPPSSKNSYSRNALGLNSHLIIKVKSHQDPLEWTPAGPDPNYLAYYANQLADRLVGSPGAMARPPVRIPPFSGRLIATYNGLALTGQKPAHHVLTTMSAAALMHWGDLHQRPQQGLVPHCRRHIHPAAQEILAPTIETDIPTLDNATRRATAYNHMLQLEPSWPGYLRSRTRDKAAVRMAYRLAYASTLAQAGYDSPTPHLQLPPIEDLCPLCLQAGLAREGGTDHYRQLQCASHTVTAAVHRVFAKAEAELLHMAPLQRWIQHAPYCTQGRAHNPPRCLLPHQYLVLEAIRWIIPLTNATPVHNAAELVWDLGFRAATFPAALTCPDGIKLTPKTVLEFELNKLLAIHHFTTVVTQELAAAYTRLLRLVPQAPPPRTAAPTPRAALATHCTHPACTVPVQQRSFPYCAMHTTQLRIREITTALQTHILRPTVNPSRPTYAHLVILTPMNTDQLQDIILRPAMQTACIQYRQRRDTPADSHLYARLQAAGAAVSIPALTNAHIPFLYYIQGCATLSWSLYDLANWCQCHTTPPLVRDTEAGFCRCPSCTKLLYTVRSGLHHNQLDHHHCPCCRAPHPPQLATHYTPPVSTLPCVHCLLTLTQQLARESLMDTPLPIYQQHNTTPRLIALSHPPPPPSDTPQHQPLPPHEVSIDELMLRLYSQHTANQRWTPPPDMPIRITRHILHLTDTQITFQRRDFGANYECCYNEWHNLSARAQRLTAEANRCLPLHMGIAAGISPLLLQHAFRHFGTRVARTTLNYEALDWLRTHSASLDPTVLEHTWIHELTPYCFCFLSILPPPPGQTLPVPHLQVIRHQHMPTNATTVFILAAQNHFSLLYPSPPHTPAQIIKLLTAHNYTHNTIARTTADQSLAHTYQMAENDN